MIYDYLNKIDLTKETSDVSVEFGTQLMKYLKHFNLSAAYLPGLSKLSTQSVDKILVGEKGIVLKSAEDIANVFGLRYFEFANPKHPLPKFEDLPIATVEAIEKSSKTGTTKITRKKGLHLPKHVKEALNHKHLAPEFTSADVMELLPKSIKEQIKSIHITNLFNNDEFKTLVEDTGKKKKTEGKRGPSQIIYRLK